MSQTSKGVGKPENANNKSKRKFRLRRIWEFGKGCFYNIFGPFARITDVGFFTAVLVGVAWMQWSTLEKTDETLKAAQRPWVSLQNMIVASDLLWNRDGGVMTINFVIKNTGHSPAVRSFTEAKGYVFFGTDPNPQTSQEKFCGEARKHNIGDAIFPGDNVINPTGIQFKRVDIEFAKRIASMKFVTLAIFVCASYRFAPNGPVHQTSYIFTLKRKLYMDSGGHKSFAIYADETVPANEIEFERFLVGSDAD